LKTEIADIGEESSGLLKLRPVSFYYTCDTAGVRQYGLIAEQVAEVMPALVRCSTEGEPVAVRYQFLVPMLVNEVQKDRKTIEEQKPRDSKKSKRNCSVWRRRSPFGQSREQPPRP
jgi:hypothetical protein